MKPISKLTENGMPVNVNAHQIQHTDNKSGAELRQHTKGISNNKIMHDFLLHQFTNFRFLIFT